MLFRITKRVEKLQIAMYNNKKGSFKMFNMKVRRVIKGMTQEQLAEKAGVSRSHITRVERGEIKPSVPVAKRLGKVLDVDWRCFYDE